LEWEPAGRLLAAVNKIVIETQMLPVKKIQKIFQIRCEPYQVAKPLAKPKIIATACYASILIAVFLISVFSIFSMACMKSISTLSVASFLSINSFFWSPIIKWFQYSFTYAPISFVT
jgi:hypothetical protein